MRYFKNLYPDFNGSLEKNDKVLGLLKDYVIKILNHRPEKSGDLYVGNSGIAYMFLKIHQFQQLESFWDKPSLEYAKNFIDLAKKYTRNPHPQDTCSFICGTAGVFGVSAIINQELKDQKGKQEDLSEFLKGFSVCQQINFNRNGSDEVLFGRAGYLSGIYWLNQNLPQSQKLDVNMVRKLCDVTIESGVNFSFSKKAQVPLLYHCWGDLYLGAAHGLSSILHMLLESQMNHPTDQSSIHKLNLVKTSIDYFLSLQTPDGNFPCTLDEVGRETKLLHWCHGAPGVIYLMAKAYLIFKEEKYLISCLKMGDLIWQKGLLLKGPGICHGVAGNGYVFLILYRLTNDQKHLYRAQKFAEFLTDEKFLREARNPDRPYSLYEGIAGTVCFLIDLLQPEKAQFPFMDVFEDKI